mmetsp:Transcript_45535/g.129906  ORF Transcript_45535/g.129906 Transcript_45535/m.129906 type:complete len:323 (+) Transcript_45535:95-1063(+)
MRPAGIRPVDLHRKVVRLLLDERPPSRRGGAGAEGVGLRVVRLARSLGRARGERRDAQLRQQRPARDEHGVEGADERPHVVVHVLGYLLAGVGLKDVRKQEGERIHQHGVVRLTDPKLEAVHEHRPAAHHELGPRAVHAGTGLQLEGEGHGHALGLGVGHAAGLDEGEVRLLDNDLQVPEVRADVPGAHPQQLLAPLLGAPERDVHVLLSEGKIGETDVADLPVAAVVVARGLLDANGREDLEHKVKAGVLELADEHLPRLGAPERALGAAEHALGVDAVQALEKLPLDVLLLEVLHDLGHCLVALELLELRQHLLALAHKL